MYDAEFGTDWTDLDKDASLERAFALGVARSLGEPDHEEYQRILDAADTAYRRSLIQLSYEEGRRKASDRATEDATSVWEALVADPDDLDPAESAPHSTDAGPSSDGPPSAVSRPRPTALPEDSLDRLRLPAFLRRR